MYKPLDKLQHSFLDFNQPMGLHMKPDNRWIKMADCIPWDAFERKYVELFPNDIGNVAKSLRMALGALIIQTKFQFADRELVEQITENPRDTPQTAWLCRRGYPVSGAVYGKRSEYFMLFFICSNLWTDTDPGICKYLLNQQTLSKVLKF